jgi:hypothetical protein
MALSRDKQIIIGGVVLLALGGAAYQTWKKDQTIGKGSISADASLPTLAGTEDVDKIRIENGDKSVVVLEKRDDKWFVAEPVKAAANQQNVKSLVDNLKELKAKEVVAPSADDQLKKQYELDAKSGVRVTAWKGSDKKVDATFGKSGGRGQMVMAEGRPEVFAASGYSSYLYTREVKNWRDTEVLRFDEANVNQMTIDKGKDGVFSFTRGDSGWGGTFKGQPIAKFDGEKVDEALRSLKWLTAEDFADEMTPEQTGLDNPAATVTINLKDNAGKYVLKVGKEKGGGDRYAIKDGADVAVVIGQNASGWATADVAKFQKSDAAKDAKKDSTAAVPFPNPHDDHGH